MMNDGDLVAGYWPRLVFESLTFKCLSMFVMFLGQKFLLLLPVWGTLLQTEEDVPTSPIPKIAEAAAAAYLRAVGGDALKMVDRF
jgi:hypothetical protein